MAFLKHVGKNGDRRVAIIFKEVPGEEHMCLVVYPDIMQTGMHDALMRVIESPEGQQANNLGEALHSKMFPDGRPMLVALHKEGMIKKVQTNTVVITPTPTSSCKLSELNNILREMQQGEEAIKRMAELDADSGMTGKARRRDDFGREVGAAPEASKGPLAGSNHPPVEDSYAAPLVADATAGLGDTSIAQNLAQQAARMEAEARSLLSEVTRLRQEAAALTGVAVPGLTELAEGAAPAKRGRGRPPKAKA